MPLQPTTRLGRYEIRSQLGAGGMGEVYLALDTQLDRNVALKILPTKVADDPQRLHRFLQEARAASKLKSANVAHIYEIGETDEQRFIAMEYIEGQPLNENLSGQPLPATELVRIGIQVARALDEAHSKGVTHRDIKPQNIMITPEGEVKVLDFGLAKLTALPAGAVEQTPDSELATRVKTSPGLVMGTVHYMSPEQAMGREVDHRTDLFSLGVVLYEMATGRVPFSGASLTETIDKITHSQPEAITRFNYNVPPELEVIVKKALRKSRDERYQTARELLVDLKNLQQELEFAFRREHSVPPQSRSNSGAGSIEEGATAILTAGQRAPGTAGVAEARTRVSSAEYLVGEVKRHRTGAFLALLGITAVIAAGIGVYKFVNRSASTTPAHFQAMKMTKLTSNGKATQAVISPDGKQVVYVISDGGRRSLWLRQVATATDVQLTAPEDVYYWSLTISPDGNFLYYVFGGTTIQNRVLYQMPVLGGNPRKVVEDVGSPIGFSPDGKQIAFVRSGQEESVLMIANADGTEERKIAMRRGPNSFGNFFQGGVAWSRDGKKIASIARSNDSAGRFQNLVEVTIEGGTERSLTSQRWYQIQRLAWLADGSGLLMTAAEKVSDFRAQQIWYLPYPGGEARKITNDLNNYGSISLNADSSVLVTVQEDQTANIWVAPNSDASRATEITSVSSKLDGFDGVGWTPDGKIVYYSMAGGREGIWIMEADGKNRRQLTTAETVDFNPSVSADGRYVVFVSERTGALSIWRMDIDGSNPKQLVSNGNYPQATAEWVVYQSRNSQSRNSLWKAPIDGGESVQLGENMMRCAVSHDGKLVACSLESPGTPARLAVMPIESGSPVKVFDVKFELPALIRWTPDGRAVAYVARQNGISDIWSQPIDGGEPKRLTNFKSDRIFSFDWSRDNKLAISHGSSKSDVVLIRNSE